MSNTIYGVSFPKAGRTWIRLMIAKIYADILHQPLKEILSQEHGKTIAYVETPLITPSGVALPHIIFRHGPEKGRISQQNHFPEKYIGKKAFLLVRDPRDIVISFFYHKRFYRKPVYHGSLNDFIRYPFLEADPDSEESRFGLMPIINFMNTFARNSHLFSEFRIFYYEDFKTQPQHELKKLLCDFAGIEVQDRLINEAVEFARFENMRKMEQENTLQWHALPYSPKSEGLKTRKGIIGGYKNELSTEEIDYLKAEIDTHLDILFERYKK